VGTTNGKCCKFSVRHPTLGGWVAIPAIIIWILLILILFGISVLFFKKDTAGASFWGRMCVLFGLILIVGGFYVIISFDFI
jgi:protein-S-isoprenylcysteine O-methyltransferase Ste14